MKIKKGISTVVASVLLVSMSIVLITLIAVFFLPTIQTWADKISIERVPLSVEVNKGYTVWDESNKLARIQVFHGTHKEKLEKMKVIFTTSGKSLSPVIVTPPSQNQFLTFDFNLTEYGKPEKVELIPIVLVNGREVELDVVSSEELLKKGSSQGYDSEKIYNVGQDYTGEDPSFGDNNIYLEDLVAYYPLTKDYGNWAETLDDGPIEEGVEEGGANVNPGFLTLDGDDDYVEFPTERLIYSGDNRSVCIWARTHSVVDKGWAFYYGSTGQGNALFVGRNGAQLLIGGFAQGKAYKKSDFWESGVWKNICSTYDSTSLRIYLDGQPYDLQEISKEWTTAEDVAYFGKMNNNGEDQYWEGDLAQFTMYNKTLTDAEILGLHNAQVATGIYN